MEVRVIRVIRVGLFYPYVILHSFPRHLSTRQITGFDLEPRSGLRVS